MVYKVKEVGRIVRYADAMKDGLCRPFRPLV